METEIHIGEVIRYLRTEKKMTQNELSDGICSAKYLRELEKGQYSPSTYIVTLLSKRLHVDIYSLFIIIKERNGLEGYRGIQILNSYIKELEYEQLESLISTYETAPAFQSGEPLQHIYYIKNLVAKHLYKDLPQAIEYCYKGLSVFQRDLDSYSNNANYSNIELILLNCLATLYYEIGEEEKCKEILFHILSNLENSLKVPEWEKKNLPFFHKLFCVSCFNLSNASFISGKLEDALEYANRGIEFSIENGDARYMAHLLLAKLQVCLELKDHETAADCYQQAKCLCKLYRTSHIQALLDEMVSEQDLKKLVPLMEC